MHACRRLRKVTRLFDCGGHGSCQVGRADLWMSIFGISSAVSCRFVERLQFRVQESDIMPHYRVCASFCEQSRVDGALRRGRDPEAHRGGDRRLRKSRRPTSATTRKTRFSGTVQVSLTKLHKLSIGYFEQTRSKEALVLPPSRPATIYASSLGCSGCLNLQYREGI